MAYEKTWHFDTNRLYVPANVPSPVMLSAVPSTASGTLAANSYVYEVTVIVSGTESLLSGDISAVLGAPGHVTLNWTAVPGASSYRLWRGTTPHTPNKVFALGNVTTYTDDGSVSVNSVSAQTPFTNILDLSKYTLWYWKSFLTGQVGGAVSGLWTLVGSSDGSTGAMDGNDRWGNTYDGTKIISNSAGSAHSWIALQSPPMAGKTFYIVIDYSYPSNGNVASFILGAGSLPTGGTATAVPTVANSAPIIPSSYGSPGVFSLDSVYGGPVRFHSQLATDGSFSLLSSRNCSHKFVNGFLCHLLANYRAADQYPVWMSINVSNTLATNGYGGGRGSYGPDVLANGVMRIEDNSDWDNYGLILPNSTNWPNAANAFDMTFDDYPLWVSRKTGGQGNIGARGRLQDISLQAGVDGGDVTRSPGPGSLDDQFTPHYTNVGIFRFPIDQRILWT